MNKAIEDVIAERKRQVEEEGWSHAHDDKHNSCELAAAAACYAICAAPDQVFNLRYSGVNLWPWNRGWFKPGAYRRNLIKAAALLEKCI